MNFAFDLGQAVLYSISLFALSTVLTLIMMYLTMIRPLGWSFAGTLHEVEVDQNAAVGLTYMILHFALSLGLGLLLSDGFTFEPTIVGEVVWIVSTLASALVFGYLVNYVTTWLLARRHNETVKQYLRREITIENNSVIAAGRVAHVASFMILMIFMLL